MNAKRNEAIDEQKLVKLRSLSAQKLLETGEKERLTELLRTRLLESGWKEELISVCKDYVKTKGVESVNIDDLINDVTPRARQMVPDAIKRELLQRIKQFLVTQIHNKGFNDQQ